VRHDHSPFPDELLTSWLARRDHSVRGPPYPQPKVVRDRNGEWRLPDIHPPERWLRHVARHFGLHRSELASITISRSKPAMPLDFLAWDWSPFKQNPEPWQPRPRLHICWCSQCLAEDFAAGRSAYIRRQWVLAVSGFCHRHRWPLEERCAVCRSYLWRFSTPARGPLRLVCQDCQRPLEQAAPAALTAEREYRDSWNRVIELEIEVAQALRGKTPDQFRINFTSADQLLNEIRDICQLLAGKHRRSGWTDMPLNSFACPAMSAGRPPIEFLSNVASFPLAIAHTRLRRCLLAAATAVIDQRPETGRILLGSDAPAAIEILVTNVDEDALNRCLMSRGRWSPTLVRRIEDVRRGTRQKIRIAELERVTLRIQQVFAHDR